MAITIGKMAKKFGLARSTLLYYDAIGLFTASHHSKGEYRFYSQEDEQRLAQICKYREAGIPLKDIQIILNSPETSVTTILEKRFAELNHEIRKLYDQQRIIAGILKHPEVLAPSRAMTKELWTSLLKQAGFTEQDMREWHIVFERTDPEKHRLFLEHLHISEDEIAVIRSWAGESTTATLDTLCPVA